MPAAKTDGGSPSRPSSSRKGGAPAAAKPAGTKGQTSQRSDKPTTAKKVVKKKKKKAAASDAALAPDAIEEEDEEADESVEGEASAGAAGQDVPTAADILGSATALPTAPPPKLGGLALLPKIAVESIPTPQVSDHTVQEDAEMTRDEWAMEQIRLSAAMRNISTGADDDPDDDRFAPPDPSEENEEEDIFAPPEVSTYPGRLEAPVEEVKEELSTRRLNSRSTAQLLSFRAHGSTPAAAP